MKLPFQKHTWKTFILNHPRERRPVPIVAAGAIGAEGLYNGRFLPVLILDASGRDDVVELLRVHEFTGPGDLKIQWGQGDEEDQIRLYLEFIRPMRLTIILDFDLAKWGLLVDHILNVRGFYIQAGDESTKISHDPMARKVVCEIPDTGIGQFWNKLLINYTAKLFRSLGFGRSESKRKAKTYIMDWRSANKAPEGLVRFLGEEPKFVGVPRGPTES